MVVCIQRATSDMIKNSAIICLEELCQHMPKKEISGPRGSPKRARLRLLTAGLYEEHDVRNWIARQLNTESRKNKISCSYGFSKTHVSV